MNFLKELQVSEFRDQFSAERGSGDVSKECGVDFLWKDLELVEEFQAEFSGIFEAFADNARMDALSNQALSLFKELSDEENV